MKRMISIGVLLLFLSLATHAQRNITALRVRQPVITGVERLQLQRDYFRLKMAQRQAERDGRLSISERKQLRRLKQKARRDRYHTRSRWI